MDNLKIEPTKSTPLIQFDYDSNQLLIKGKSYPENTYNYYEPVLKWLEQYLLEGRSGTVFKFEIEYYNSGSSKIFFDIFAMIEEQIENCKDFNILWLYEEEDEIIQEAGEDLASDFKKINITLQILEE